MIVQLLVLRAVFVDKFREFNVVTAIFSDFQQATFTKPLDGLEAFGGFFDAESSGSEGIQGKTMLQGILQFHHHVERGKLAQIHRSVTVQDFIIKAQVVETDDQIRALQFAQEIVHLFFAIDAIIAPSQTVSDAHTHAHGADVIPSAHLIGGLLRFQVEINEVLHELGNLTPTGVAKSNFALLAKNKNIFFMRTRGEQEANFKLNFRTHLMNRGGPRCKDFGATARREEGEYPSWIFD